METKLKKLLATIEKDLLRKPNRKTLDHLSLLAGFQSWDDFEDTLEGTPSQSTAKGEDNKKAGL